MSVTVNKYSNAIGNDLPRYCFARYFSLIKKMNLNTNLPSIFNKILTPTLYTITDLNLKKYNILNKEYIMEIEKNQSINLQGNASKGYIQYLNNIITDLRFDPPAEYYNRCIYNANNNENWIVNGYFQNGDFFGDKRDIIKTFFNLPKLNINKDDIVIHCRLTDFSGQNSIIHPDWYLNILEKENFNKLYIVTDDPSSINFFKFFEKFKPIIISKSGKEDFHFLMSFEKIICSLSTFCWWAAYLGNAKKIYVMKHSTDNFLNRLSVSNNKEYINVENDKFIKDYNILKKKELGQWWKTY